MTAGGGGGVVRPGEGREVRFGPNRLTVKVGPESWSRRLGIFESVLLPGAGAFVHRHRSYEEAFYVLEGEIEYRLDERLVRCEKGARLPHGTEASTNVNDTSRVAADSGISRSRV